MTEMRWEADVWGCEALFVPKCDPVRLSIDPTLRAAISKEMNGRRYQVKMPVNRDGVWCIPEMLWTYGCEHADEVVGPNCPHCGAAVVCWQ